jgi:hypothetical protein
MVLFGVFSLAGMFKAAMSGATTRSADLAYVAAVGFGALMALGLGLGRDLARAAAVRGSLRAKEALLAGWQVLARFPGRALLGWAAPASAGLALVLIAAALTTTLDVSRPGAWRIALVALLHQAVAYALCWCRAFWLHTSLAMVAAAERPAAGDE